MNYKTEQQMRGERLIKEGFFSGDPGGGSFMGKPRPFVLQNGLSNLFPEIQNDVLKYFNDNKIAWWGGVYPTGHVLSSQIACLNHLFTIRNQKESVVNLLKSVSEDFTDVLPIIEEHVGYIQFEAVGGDYNFLNEGTNTRGSNCTSVDALIRGVHKDGRKFLIPIEWKYVEVYGNDDKSVGNKGITRKSRYLDLIAASRYLNDNTLKCCWYEPFYQLMRQTLWAEQMLKKKPKGFEADDYLHVHVVPDGNVELLSKSYLCTNQGMEATWKGCLVDPNKYVVISPEKLWSKQNKDTDTYSYLKKRYWEFNIISFEEII